VATRAYVAVKGLVVTWGPDSAERDLARTEEIIAACREAGDVALELQTRNWRINAFLELGDLTAVDQEMARVEHMAHVLRQPRALAFLPVHRALRALLEGRFAEARALLTDDDGWWSGSVGSSAGLVHESQVMAMHWLLRTLDAIEPLIHASVVALPGVISRRCALLIAYCDAARPAEALRELDLLGSRGFADLPRDNSWRAAMALLAEGSARLRAPQHAAALRELLAPYGHLHVIAPQGAYLGPVSRSLALLDATLGEVASARENFTAAWNAAERLGAQPLLVRLTLEQAEVLGDTERVPEARDLAARLGMERMAVALGALEAAPAAAGDRLDPSHAALRREGEFWTLTYEGRSTRLNDARGLHHLAFLLAHPGVEVHAIDLVAGPATPAPARDAAAAHAAASGELAVRAGGGDAGTLLDPQAKAAYKARLEDLREEVDEAEAFNDPERASRAREEMEFIAHELAGAVGIGGRDRKAASDAERARVNATRAIRSVVKRIGEYDPVLARLLDTTVRTGTFCVYEPDPRHPVVWEIAAD